MGIFVCTHYVCEGQPWYMPLTWPIGYVSSAILKPNDESISKPTATAMLVSL